MTIVFVLSSMSGPNSSSEWSIEGRRLVPLMPRLVPQTAFTVTANAVASATANQNASLLLPAETGNKEGKITDSSRWKLPLTTDLGSEYFTPNHNRRDFGDEKIYLQDQRKREEDYKLSVTYLAL